MEKRCAPKMPGLGLDSIYIGIKAVAGVGLLVRWVFVHLSWFPLSGSAAYMLLSTLNVEINLA